MHGCMYPCTCTCTIIISLFHLSWLQFLIGSMPEFGVVSGTCMPMEKRKKPVLRHSSSNWHISNSETHSSTMAFMAVDFMVNTRAFMLIARTLQKL